MDNKISKEELTEINGYIFECPWCGHSVIIPSKDTSGGHECKNCYREWIIEG